MADNQPPPDKLVAMCDRAEIPLFVTTESAGHVIDVVRAYLAQLCANRTTRHGVFMDILGLGVLLTGESGLGKSELGLELISRGHGLVADDAVDLFRISQTAIEGRCPELAGQSAGSAWHRPAGHQGHHLARPPCAARCGSS